MAHLLFTVIPLDLAATLSPGILALTLILLGSKKSGISSTLSLLIGNLITSGIIITAAFLLTQVTTVKTGPNTISAVIDVALGIFFVLYGIKVLRTKDGKFKLKNKSSSSLKWLIIGFIISITNFDAVLLSFTATREVAASNLNFLSKVVLSGMNAFFFVLPITLPLGLCLLFPKIGERFLKKLNKYVMKYSRFIIFLMFVVFGIYFILRAFKHF